MSNVMYARVDATVVWSKGISPIAKGDVWDSEAELVVERPDLFSAEPTLVRGQVYRSPVATAETAPEQASDAPPRSESGRAVDKPTAKRGR